MIADEESRTSTDAANWRLDAVIFKRVLHRYPAKVDLFASLWNDQLERFIGWRPQPDSWRINAFSVNWNSLEGAMPFPHST